MAKEYTIIDTIEITMVVKSEEAPACFKAITGAIRKGYEDALKEELNVDGAVVTDRKVFEHSDESEYGAEREANVSSWEALTFYNEDYRCRKCGFVIHVDEGGVMFRYCPHCGRYMMGVE